MSGDASIGNSHPPPRAEFDGAGSTNASAQRRTHGAGPEPEAGAWRLAEPVAIWFRITQSLSAEDVDLARLTLSPDERARCDRFVFERDRRDFAAAHALLRDVLSRYGWLSPAEWTFTAEAGGKPHLADPSELQFNIAHTRGLVACALSLSGPIGVDVESIAYDRDVELIAERYFAPAELADLRAFPDSTRRCAYFTELWTSKEAYLKALGSGLQRPLNEIAFRFSGASEIRATSDGAPIDADWRFGLFAPRSDFRLAAAVSAKNPIRFRAREWPEKPDQPELAPTRWSR